MAIPVKTKITSIILKSAVIIAATLGVCLSAFATSDTFMGSTRVFMFFTIQSNIAVAFISLAGLILLLGKKNAGRAWYVIKFVGTVSITLTGAVFTFILAPTFGVYAWNLQNVLTHVAVPAAAIIDFFVTGIYGDVRKRDIPYVIIPPLMYAVYAGIGYIAGWEFSEGYNYPYFFLNWGSPAGAFGFTDKLPFMGSGWWITALLIVLIAAGFIYLLIIDALKKKILNSK